MPVRRARPVAGLFAAVVIALVALLPSNGWPASDLRFTIAVLRRDGAILPIASYDGGRWTSRWPSDPATPVPIGLADVPGRWWQGGTPALKWTAWLTSGASQQVTVTAPVLLRVHCTRRIGLRTDFMSADPPPPPGVQPYPKSGLAVAGASIRVDPVTIVSLNAPAAAAFAKSVAADVTAAETRRVRQWSGLWRHPADEKARAETPLTLELMAYTPGVRQGSQVHYFEGVKKYSGIPRWAPGAKSEVTLETCDYLTIAGGWVVGDPADPKTRPEVGAELTNCDREGVVYGLPLGAIRVDGRLFWVIQSSGWENERYEVIEIKNQEVKPVLSVGGGSCPSS